MNETPTGDAARRKITAGPRGRWAVMRDGKVMIQASSEAHAQAMMTEVKARTNLGEWTVAELDAEGLPVVATDPDTQKGTRP